jgi:hypothetical protein
MNKRGDGQVWRMLDPRLRAALAGALLRAQRAISPSTAFISQRLLHAACDTPPPPHRGSARTDRLAACLPSRDIRSLQSSKANQHYKTERGLPLIKGNRN